ncbi:MAG: M13 family metallopeptidase [Muribaculaceae bacterium]|nr:M13 family metallopeptidase [Muribaculaceae bacterium]
MRTTKLLTLSLAMIAMTMSAGNLNKGVDRSNLDPSTKPGENFYQYACGGWMKNNPLDPQYARFGTFDQLRENNNTQLKELIQNLGTNNPKGSLAQKVSDLYLQGMDSTLRNQQGTRPVEMMLAQIYQMPRNSLEAMIADLHTGIASPFFDSGVMADLKNSDVNLLYLGAAGLGMGDRDYYLENDENTVKVRNAYLTYIEKLFTLSGRKVKDAKKSAKNILALETEFAKVAMTREESRDYSKQYNIRTVDQLKADYPNFDWDAYFNLLFPASIKVEKVCVAHLNSMAKFNEMLGTLKDNEIRDYLAFKYLDAASNYLSDEFVQASFDMYGRAMSGTQVMQPRWKRALNVPNGVLGEAVGELYVKKYFPEESKQKMIKLVNNLRIALAEHIAGLTWMSPKTKVNALVKLNSFTVKVGYPDTWRDYSGINIDPDNYYWENVRNARRFEAEYRYSQLNKPVDKAKWQMTPQTVNAYYDPSTNEICFPAGILQKPYFDPDADDACNYGAIGVVIGHEMTHGFDDQGRNFDQNGNMIDWWTEEDAAKFQELANKLGAQYSAEIVADDVHANGTFTMGENIADHGGLRVAYSAFKKTEQGASDEKIDGFTPDQRFFLSYANVWANNITKEEILRRTKVDPHSLGINRVNVAIRNLEPFFKAFDIQPGDKMWRDPADRVTIW